MSIDMKVAKLLLVLVNVVLCVMSMMYALDTSNGLVTFASVIFGINAIAIITSKHYL